MRVFITTLPLKGKCSYFCSLAVHWWLELLKLAFRLNGETNQETPHLLEMRGTLKAEDKLGSNL